jgi:imidazolonepropionase-like amidohydrolase
MRVRSPAARQGEFALLRRLAVSGNGLVDVVRIFAQVKRCGGAEQHAGSHVVQAFHSTKTSGRHDPPVAGASDMRFRNNSARCDASAGRVSGNAKGFMAMYRRIKYAMARTF